MNGLVGFWEEYNPQEGPPFLHPTDREYMDAHGGLRQLWAHPDEDAQAYLQHFAERHEHPDRFHLALRPFPFAGNLETADVVILMLNPRFVLSEYYANAHVGYINALQSTMTQTFDGIGFPFMWLDPQFLGATDSCTWRGSYVKYCKQSLGVSDSMEVIGKPFKTLLAGSR